MADHLHGSAENSICRAELMEWNERHHLNQQKLEKTVKQEQRNNPSDTEYNKQTGVCTLSGNAAPGRTESLELNAGA